MKVALHSTIIIVTARISLVGILNNQGYKILIKILERRINDGTEDRLIQSSFCAE